MEPRWSGAALNKAGEVSNRDWPLLKAFLREKSQARPLRPETVLFFGDDENWLIELSVEDDGALLVVALARP